MIRRPPRSTRTDTLVPYTTLFRSRLNSGVMPHSEPMSSLRPSSTPSLRGCPGCRVCAPDPSHGSRSALQTPRAALVRYALAQRSEEHTSELQSLMRISYAVFCLKKKNDNTHTMITYTQINTP